MTTIVPAEMPVKEAPEKKKCVVCDSEIARDERDTCPVCLSNPDGKKCKNCKKRMPIGATFCNSCKEYENWRKNFAIVATVLSVIVGFIGISKGLYLAADYLGDRHSHTMLKVTGASDSQVYLKIWNTGRKPSALLSYRLKFDQLSKGKEITLQQPIEDVLSDSTSVIAPGKEPITIKLGRPRLVDLSDNQHQAQYSEEELRTLRGKEFGSVPVTLEIDVEESDDDEGTSHRRQDHFNAARIEKIMPRLLQ